MVPINVGNRIVNNWIYPIDNGYVLVDTGYETSFNRFLKNLGKQGIKAEDIKYVFLTHAHDDHAGFLNQLLTMAPDVKVIMHSNAIAALSRGQNSFTGGCTSRVALLFCLFMKLLGRGTHRFPPLGHCFEERCIFITDENRGDLEKRLHGRILETPGHTADSISLIHHSGVLFCGDAAMSGFPSLHKITIWAENKVEFAESWNKIIALNPKIIYPGHGNAIACNELKNKLPFVQVMKLYPLKPS